MVQVTEVYDHLKHFDKVDIIHHLAHASSIETFQLQMSSGQFLLKLYGKG